MFFAFKTILLFIYLLGIYAFGVFINLIIFSEYVFSHFSNEHSAIPAEYDYIVGSGSAGSIIARRLAEDKTSKILLLEAGSYSNSLLNIPPVGLMLQTSPFDWQYRTVPQKHACQALQNQTSFWPMGKVFGGTANLNNMVYTRGHPNDYAEWFRSVKNFDYEKDILPYFKKLEEDSQVKNVEFLSPLSESLHEAGKHLGFPENDGLTSYPGFAIPKANIVNGARWTSSHYLRANKLTNLKILTNSVAEKVLLRADFEAYAVKYSHFNRKHTVKARKAIILSAGTIASPKILLLSGIGPADHLNSLKIKPRVNLDQLGENLQDHLSSGLDLILLNSSLGLGIQDMLSPSSILQYFSSGRGPWATVGCENIAFFTSNTTAGAVPDLQFMALPLGVATDSGAFLAGLAGIGRDLLDNYFKKINQTSISILPIVLHPKSRGTLRLLSKNPEVLPEIDPKYLSRREDLEVMLRGIKIIKDVVKAPSMVRLGAELNKMPFPGCESFVFDSDEYWECYLRRMSVTCYHPVGTCAMGKVVSLDFQVFGTSKLYVADGSVLPGLPSGNPNAAIMMMAERAADAVKRHGFLFCGRSRLEEIFLGIRECEVCNI